MNICKDKSQKKQVNLSKKIIRIVSVVLAAIIVTIILVTDKGLDTVYLVQSAVNSFMASYEIEDVYNNHSDDFLSVMDSIEREYAITVEIYSDNGKCFYSSSYKGEMSVPPYDSHSVVVPDSARKNYEVILDLGTAAGNNFNLSRDSQGQKNTEYLVGSWDTESGITIRIFSVKSNADNNAKIAVAFVAVVTILFSYLGFIAISVFVRRVTKPLEEMSEITKNMSSLDFSRKCKSNNVSEIAVLADSINEMSDSLETSLEDLRLKNKKLQDDIEQEKTIDRLRQMFISGISHELKTPIAIIQGYSEGLKMFLDQDPEMAQKYCDTIISETQRMNNLVMKLLDIAKYESGEYKLLYEQFNIREVVSSWFERNEEIFREKGIDAINDVDPSVSGFGDSFILATVINNYLSNAVAHVDGEKTIRVYAEETENGCYRIYVYNTGNHIEAKDIDQIWNSFYRVDKAMSRAQGRFGLGLAIVASIQKLHEKEYGVENCENGVRFWFDVKKAEL